MSKQSRERAKCGVTWQDGLPALPAHLAVTGVRRLRNGAWHVMRGDILHARMPRFETWERAHYWPGDYGSEAKRLAAYREFVEIVTPRIAEAALVADGG